jgi:hypothetical protein
VLAGVIFFGTLRTYSQVGSDLLQDYRAACALRQAASIYHGTITLDETLMSLGSIRNDHPPTNAVLFVPLSFLPYRGAFWMMGFLSLMALAAISWLVVSGLGLPRGWAFYATVLGVYWYPFAYCIGLGQSSLIIAALVVGGWYAERQGKNWFAGALFATATLMKLFPGLVLFYLLLQRRWRGLATTVACLAIGAIGTAGLVGWDDLGAYAEHSMPTDMQLYRGFVLNASLAGVVYRLVGPETELVRPLVAAPRLAANLTFALDLAVLAASGVYVARLRETSRERDRAFALTSVAMLLISPLTWSHVFFVLIMPIGLLLADLRCRGWRDGLPVVLLLIVLLGIPDVPIARTLAAAYAPDPIPWYVALVMSASTAGLCLVWWVVGPAHPIWGWNTMDRGTSAQCTAQN